MNVLVLALIIVALVLAAVAQITAGGKSILAWAVIATDVALLLGKIKAL